MKKYWKNIEGKEQKGKKSRITKNTGDESPAPGLFPDFEKYTAATRRDFLKMCGYSFAVAALASCQAKIGKAVPYALAPPEVMPGSPLFYASSYINGSEYASILVKTRDGRPIKIEGNPDSGISKGRTNARTQASVLDLYDTNRYKNPSKNGGSADWITIDKEITENLQKISSEKGTIVLLTPTIFSPSTESVISDFLKKYPGTEWIEYDPISSSAISEACEVSFGKRMIPDYRFDKADVIVSFGADLLGTWLSPVEYTAQFASRREPDKEMNLLIQLESNLSLTGCNADLRIQISPSQEAAVLINIYKEVLLALEQKEIQAPLPPVDVKEITARLLAAKGSSLVISSTNDKNIQLLINDINILLGNPGKTILFKNPLRTRRGNDSRMEKLVTRMKEGRIAAILVWNVNPAYTYYNSNSFKEGLKNVELTVSLSGSPDETTTLMDYVCPDNHYLESWGDAEAKQDMFSLLQPAISPIFNTRQMQDTLLKWSGSAMPFYDFIHAWWIKNLMPRQSEIKDPLLFFDLTLQKGVFEPVVRPGTEHIKGSLQPLSALNSFLTENVIQVDNQIEVILYESIAMGDGRQANNPWLQELPDPVSRICWDNYASVSPKQAKELGLKDNDIISVGSVELPVHIQPGQAPGTIGIALGYGRTFCGKVGDNVGKDLWHMVSFENDCFRYSSSVASIVKTGLVYPFAQTQTHHSMEGRALVREALSDEYKKDPAAGNELHAFNLGHHESLYKVREYPHHKWGMAVDLSKCIGCGTCVIACQAENNIPVVGKTEVHRVHEMHWMRIDRYYTGSEDDPEVVFQPVLCQHCENAPCENVCPVAATNHSEDGLNQMIYNRCFGTRYCNNNCPYKVRRFNWFNYTAAGTLGGNLRDKAGMTEDLRRMVLNPDVTVRTQGVIEKCSFCVQRIQAAKLSAKAENRAMRQDEVQTACSQACPANAIVFGDMINPDSELSRLISGGRRYNLLEELFTKPSVNYLTKIRNYIS